MNHSKAEQLVAEARKIALKVDSWITFSNALSAPQGGLIARYFPEPEERKAFLRSPQYAQINQLLLETIERMGLIPQPAASKSGKFLVRLPRTLHAALEMEAEKEGVSLNQLAATKLTVGLRESTGLSPIAEAFRRVHAGHSTERVVVDPELNKRFIQSCRELGLSESEYQLNHSLFDLRKSKKALLPPTTKPTKFGDYDRYEFASEIAFRHLQRNEGVTLDRVLCDPAFRTQFDEIARRLAPKHSVLQLRWAALNLRKSHRLRPHIPKSEMYDLVSVGPVTQVNLDDIPAFPGIYVFYEDTRPLFAGETEELRERFALHMESSEHRGLPMWLGLNPDRPLDLKYLALPAVGREERIYWLMQFVNEERPLFNYQLAA